MMLLNRRDLGLLALAFPLAARAKGSIASDSLAFSVEVPIDHDRPEAGRVPLACEWGAPPKEGLPLVILIADGQQFYLRPGGAARIRGELFGNAVNVVSIVGRSRIAALARLIMPQGKVDWARAYDLLRARQWMGDIETVIARLSAGRGILGLYGQSGGAHLIHQFMARRPDLGARVYIQAAVNHSLDSVWGVSADRFWDEFSARNPDLAKALVEAVVRAPERRRDIVLILQRQHFFETVEALPAAREGAVRAFLEEDKPRLAALREKYQIDLLAELANTLEGVGSAVRLWEFAWPYRGTRASAEALHPDIESIFHYSAPLADGPQPAVPTDDWSRLRRYSGEVLQMAGRFDHTCDYRTQIGLAGLTQHSRLMLLDDNHVFHRLNAGGRLPGLLQTFMTGGLQSPAFATAANALAPVIWREG